MGLQRVRQRTEQLIHKTIKKRKGIMKIKIQVVVISEKAMATHSSVLAWRIPGMGKPGGLPSMGLHRVGHN